MWISNEIEHRSMYCQFYVLIVAIYIRVQICNRLKTIFFHTCNGLQVFS